MRLLYILLYLLNLNKVSAQQFHKEEVLEDMEFLKNSLEDTHYNLYAYVSKKDFLLNYELVKGTVRKDSLNLLEVTNLFQRVISAANTGHAEIDFPATSYRTFAANEGTVFPLELAIEEGNVFIRRNFSGAPEAREGLILKSIDGRDIDYYLKKMYPQLSAETPYFKGAKLEFWSFPRLYWQVFGEKEQFKVIVEEEGNEKNLVLDAVDLIEDFELKRTDIIDGERKLVFYEKAAYLKPGNFSGDEDQFKVFVDSCFLAIRNNQKENLILDFRNNSGGHNSFSDYLVAYIADHPFRWYSAFTLKSSKLLKEQTRLNSDTTGLYEKEILSNADGSIYSYEFDPIAPQEKVKRYEGKIYVLVNRHSYSMAAVTAAMLKDEGFATVVGEETGDFPTLHAAQFSYSLPNTGIAVKVPKGYIVRPNGNEDRRGVIPDVLERDHLIDEKDEILNKLLKKL